jgi:hypothetical protein
MISLRRQNAVEGPAGGLWMKRYSRNISPMSDGVNMDIFRLVLQPYEWQTWISFVNVKET